MTEENWPDIRTIGQSGKNLQLMEDYKYVIKSLSWITVPKGYKFDGASVPQIFWTITGITPQGIFERAALIHDYLYQHGYELGFTREEVDNIFKDIMTKDGIKSWQVWIAYKAVRWFGEPNWNTGK